MALVVSLTFGVINLVIPMLMGGGGFLGAATSPTYKILVLPALLALEQVVFSVGVTALHTELVIATDGATHSQVAEIFG